MNSRLPILFTGVVVAGACFSDPQPAPTIDDQDVAHNSANDTSNGATNSRCEPADEACNGEDDDCDGDVDEDFALGVECTVGVGGCEATGVTVCSGDGTETVCDAEVGEPGDELCDDGIDNDCDGEVDEGFDDLGMDCARGEGVCATDGVTVCSEDLLATVCDATPPEPPEEPEATCDALDNDCDGEVDEGCDDDGDGFCDDSFVVVMPEADALCVDGGDDCDDDDDAVYPGAPGLCDGKDNDCNGTVDDIRAVAGATVGFQLSGFAASGLQHGPIQATPSDSGFCIYMTGANTGDRSINEAHFDSSTGTVAEFNAPSGREEEVADIVWTGTDCAAVVVEHDGGSRDLRLRRWSKDLTARASTLVVDDRLFEFQNSWNASLEWFGGEHVIGYASTSGTDAEYVRLDTPFGPADSPTAPRQAGKVGNFPVLRTSPGTGDLLFFSNFVNVQAFQFDVGSDAGRVDALTLSGTGLREVAVGAVDGITWIAMRDDSAKQWVVTEIEASLDYGRSGTINHPTVALQDFVGRSLFSAGPAGGHWFADPIGEVVYALDQAAADPASVVATAVATHPNDAEILTLRNRGDDHVEVLWMTDAGNPTADATFDVTTHTCH